MGYDITFENKYIQPGFIIYKKDYTKFLKIFPNMFDNNQTFTFIVSDEYMDHSLHPFRHFSFEIMDDSPLYDVFLELVVEKNIFFSTSYSSEGFNQLRIEKRNNSIVLIFFKDLRYKKNRIYEAMHLTVKGENFYNFYHKLSQINKPIEDKNSHKVLKKMLDLKATRIGI